MARASSSSAPVLAAPAVRQFSFFSQSLRPTSDTFASPHHISTIASCPHSDLVLVADLEGGISVIDEEGNAVRHWRAYGDKGDGRCTMIKIVGERWKGIVVTLGDDAGSLFPLLRIWSLGPTTSTSPPTLLRESKIQSPTSTTRPHPVSAMCISSSLEHIVLGLADGTVVAFKGVGALLENGIVENGKKGSVGVQGVGKLRVLREGKDPITGLGLRSTGYSGGKDRTTLFILTTSHVLSCSLSTSLSMSGTAKPTVIDDLGAGVGCSTVLETKDGARMVIARDEAVYVYGGDGREGCYAYEGPKSAIHALSSAVSSSASNSSRSPYIIIVSPPLLATVASNSATVRNYARNLPSGAPTPRNGASGVPGADVAKVTVFDLENKFVAYSGTYEDGVRDVWEAWGAVWILSEAGKLYRLTEQPLAASLSTLFGKNLFTLAVSLAQSRGLPPSEVAEIYRRYGDHLYGRSDFEGAMGCYLKTVGTVQASYVIRKFLDAQRLSHLTSYLQELHSRGLANSDHTTLLLNCYTKLADDTALSSFLHSSSNTKLVPLPTGSPSVNSPVVVEEPPFDLETAIRVCRQAGYFEHAVWLAQRYGEHQEYLRIQIEDRSDFDDAIRYLRTLGSKVAEDNLVRYGKTLLAAEPGRTTELLVDLCCGSLERELEVRREEGRKAGSEKGYMAYLGYSNSTAVGGATTADNQGNQPSPSPSVKTPSRTAVAQLRSSASTEVVASNRKSGIFPGYQVPDALPPATITEEIFPSPRQFFAHYVDHPAEFIEFLEAVAERRYGKTLNTMGSSMDQANGPLVAPQPLRALEFDDGEAKDEQAIWNALLELYLSNGTTLESKALQLLRSRDRIPYDETQALLVCTTAQFTAGFILLYEQLGMYDDIIRYWIDFSSLPYSPPSSSDRVIQALRRYGSARPYLYTLVLRYLTTSSDLLSRHQDDVSEILLTVDTQRILPPIAVVQILSKGGMATVGLLSGYLKRQLARERDEVDSDRALIESYRSESKKKEKEIRELEDPETSRIFQVTRCSACGGSLELPAVHFMCRHSYHQRCLAENESQCPNCAREHGTIMEIRRGNAEFAGRHDLFLGEVEDSEDGYATIASAYSKGLMSFTSEV